MGVLYSFLDVSTLELLLKIRLMLCYYWGHGDIWAQDAIATSHAWVHGPAVARVCVDVCCLYYHRGL